MPVDLDGMLYKLQSSMKSKRNNKAGAYESKGVRNITTSEKTQEQVNREARLKKFLARRREDPDYVRKRIEARKRKLGLPSIGSRRK